MILFDYTNYFLHYKIKIKKNDSFYLNNSKLLKKIKINISKQQFLKFCQTI